MRTDTPEVNGVTLYNGLPAINVKIHGAYHRLAQDGAEYVRGALADPARGPLDIERALEWAFEAEQAAFWEQTEGVLLHAMHGTGCNKGLTVSQDGRSGGWLTVSGLPPVEEWTPALHEGWAEFERLIDADIRYRLSGEAMLEAIEVSGWAEPEPQTDAERAEEYVLTQLATVTEQRDRLAEVLRKIVRQSERRVGDRGRLLENLFRVIEDARPILALLNPDK